MTASAPLLAPTFDLHGEAVALDLVPVLHPDSVVPTVLHLGPDQGQHALVSAGRPEAYGTGTPSYISHESYSLITFTTSACLSNACHLCYAHIRVNVNTLKTGIVKISHSCR